MLTPRGLTVFLLAAAALAVTLVDGGPGRARRLAGQVPALEADQILAELRAGNARFIKSARTLSTDTAHDAELRRKTAREQHPVAAMLCCADSRVVPEFIFDQPPGTIFEIRNAGNVVDEDVMASLEYAVEHLHVPLILVMGHKGCGAVRAVQQADDHPLPDHLRELQKHMAGLRAHLAANRGWHDAHFLDRLSEENARQQALLLKRDCRMLRQAVEHGHARLFYALYDMETGAALLHELP